jgi:hypothetical protein
MNPEAPSAASSPKSTEAPTLEVLRENLRRAAREQLAAGGDKAAEVMPSIIAAGSIAGFEKTFPDQTVVDTEAAQMLLEQAARDAARAFNTVVTGSEKDELSPGRAEDNKKRFSDVQSEVPLVVNKVLAHKFAGLVYPDANPSNVAELLEKTMTFATIGIVTARQLGLSIPDLDPKLAVAALEKVTPQDPGNYSRITLERLRGFLEKEHAMHNEKDLITTDLLLRLANAVWAGGAVKVAAFKNQPERLEAEAFDTPEGRTRAMYERFSKEYDPDTAYYLTVFENAKDYLNLIS